MRWTSSALFALVMIFMPTWARAQDPDCTPGRPLVSIPEIPSKNGLLQGVLRLSDEPRSVAGKADGTSCREPRLRYFEGYSTQEPRSEWPHRGEPIPGPTLRARVGDLVQLTFLNQIDYRNFINTLDQGEHGKTAGCDVRTAQDPNDPERSSQIYPRVEDDGPSALGDAYPNCLHGSSTTNVHFHGTHTTPKTTGDNVLLFIRPALRPNPPPAEDFFPRNELVEEQFAGFFEWCATHGPPQRWEQMPAAWQAEQKNLLQIYDATAPYKGVPGYLPAGMRLWPKNEARLKQGLWPQYSIGAYPYCFSLPRHDPAKVRMGQAPGTHWYHAHKHGSTALNVANGMSGAFVIEGEYDDALRAFYKATPEHKNWGLEEKVLVIQQLSASLNLLTPQPSGPPPLSVNGRLNPVVTMKPGQVQLWRVINTAPIQAVQFHSFAAVTPGGPTPEWRQIAQDGVQFAFSNYQRVGKVNSRFNLAAANRADLLVRAPAQEGEYALQIVASVHDIPSGSPKTLLTVKVQADDEPIDPPMGFIEREEDFPPLPEFLSDIEGPYYIQRELRFNTVPNAGKGPGIPHHEINGKIFDGEHVDQTMTLDTAEEWKVLNQTTNIAHPFHIHINPFQVVEVFQPNLPAVKDKNGPCYADPVKPETWKPCDELKLEPPYVWGDVFAIPTARKDDLDPSVCTELAECPADIRSYTTCANNKCSVTIPGYFKKRSRFVDFPGQYVLHCHILAHEDRGMMELVEVVPLSKTQYEHH